jgi:hypothetical protein
LVLVKKNKEELNTSKDLGNLQFLQPQAASKSGQKILFAAAESRAERTISPDKERTYL